MDAWSRGYEKWLATSWPMGPLGAGPAQLGRPVGLGMAWVPVCHGGGPYAGTTMFWRCPLYSSPLWPMGPEGLDLPDGAGQWVQTPKGATTSGLGHRGACSVWVSPDIWRATAQDVWGWQGLPITIRGHKGMAMTLIRGLHLDAWVRVGNFWGTGLRLWAPLFLGNGA